MARVASRGRVALVAGLVAGACAAPPGSRPVSDAGAAVEPVLVSHPQPRVAGALRIAAIFPSVGRYALSGVQSLNGVRLAVEAINAAGGIHGRPIELLEYRTGSYFLDAARAAGLAASEGGALGVVGSNSSSLSMAVAEVVEAHGLVQLSNVSTAHDLTWDPETGRVRRFVFRMCGSDLTMARLLAGFALRELGAKRVAILYEVGRTYSAHLAGSFGDAFASEDGDRQVQEFGYLPLETDFRDQLRDLKAWGPDTVFIPGSFSDATLVGIQAEQLGIEATLLGADGWSNHLLFQRGGPARPAYFGDHCAPPEGFRERYRKAYREPDDGCRAILAYDALQTLAVALRDLGPLRDEELVGDVRPLRVRLRDAVAGVRFDGAAGPVRFDGHGDSQRPIAVVQVLPEPGGGRSMRLFRMLGGA